MRQCEAYPPRLLLALGPWGGRRVPPCGPAEDSQGGQRNLGVCVEFLPLCSPAPPCGSAENCMAPCNSSRCSQNQACSPDCRKIRRTPDGWGLLSLVRGRGGLWPSSALLLQERFPDPLPDPCIPAAGLDASSTSSPHPHQLSHPLLLHSID